MQADDEGPLGRHQIRQQKLRITKYVECLIPTNVIAAGALIMVMQVDSPVNGSMFHTVISIVFPLPERDGVELIKGLKESGDGGTFRTTIYRPLIDVARDDVLDAFPEQFPGGRRTMERLKYRARDVALGQIEQDMGKGNADQKREIAEFVIKSLQQYLEHDCLAPEMGRPFPMSPEEEVIAAVAKTNLQRKEINDTRKKAVKMRKAREEAEATAKKQQQQKQQKQKQKQEQIRQEEMMSHHHVLGGYDSDPFEDVNNPLRQASKKTIILDETLETVGSNESFERNVHSGHSREPPGVRASDMGTGRRGRKAGAEVGTNSRMEVEHVRANDRRREHTAEVFSSRDDAFHEVEEYKMKKGHRVAGSNKGKAKSGSSIKKIFTRK